MSYRATRLRHALSRLNVTSQNSQGLIQPGRPPNFLLARYFLVVQQHFRHHNTKNHFLKTRAISFSKEFKVTRVLAPGYCALHLLDLLRQGTNFQGCCLNSIVSCSNQSFVRVVRTNSPEWQTTETTSPPCSGSGWCTNHLFLRCCWVEVSRLSRKMRLQLN